MEKYAIFILKNNRATGNESILFRMGVVSVKNYFDFSDMVTFGLFFLVLPCLHKECHSLSDDWNR